MIPTRRRRRNFEARMPLRREVAETQGAFQVETFPGNGEGQRLLE